MFETVSRPQPPGMLSPRSGVGVNRPAPAFPPQARCTGRFFLNSNSTSSQDIAVASWMGCLSMSNDIIKRPPLHPVSYSGKWPDFINLELSAIGLCAVPQYRRPSHAHTHTKLSAVVHTPHAGNPTSCQIRSHSPRCDPQNVWWSQACGSLASYLSEVQAVMSRSGTALVVQNTDTFHIML